MLDDAKITVVIPTYNRSADLQRALESVFKQTYPPDEVIIIDDCSSDDTSEVIKEYGDEIIYLRNPINSGASASRNTGINKASGNYIAFLDSDDVWSEVKLEHQVRYMKLGSLEASVTGFAVGYQGNRGVEVKSRPYTEITTEDCLWGVYSAPGTTLICNTQLLKDVNGYNTQYKRLEDWELFFKLTQRVRIGFLNENLAFISPSGGPALPVFRESCNLLLRDAPKLLGDNYDLYIKRLRAGVDFEFAVICWKSGDYLRSLLYFLISYLRSPRGHNSLEIILLPALKNRFCKIKN